MKITIGKIKNIIYNQAEDSLEILIKINDKKFQKQLLRDLDLKGEICFDGSNLIYTPKVEISDADI